MIAELKSVLSLLQEINSQCKSAVITQEEFEEETENLKDFKGLLNNLKKLVDSIEDSNKNKDEIDSTVEQLIHLHLKLSDSIWHIEQIHELVKRMAGNYRESV